MKTIDQIKNRVLLATQSISDAMAMINDNNGALLAIINPDGTLAGTISDGDIRRSLLAGNSLEMSVRNAMQCNPLVAYENSSPSERLNLMLRHNIDFLPVLDSDGILIGAITIQPEAGKIIVPTEAVIMCGGLGQRLGRLTANCPKPMLRVRGIPILERILQGLAAHGIVRFFLATNYLREQIEDYFGDGANWNIEINYLHENTRMGTGGALSLLKHRPTSPMIVMNGDILTDMNFTCLLNTHNANGDIATMGIVNFKYQIPYGIIHQDTSQLIAIEEKPVQSWYINSGIYVINPELLDFVPENQFIDMPTILLKAKEAGKSIGVYPIYENWLDIGRKEDYDFAQILP